MLLRTCSMNKLLSTLALPIVLMMFVLLGSCGIPAATDCAEGQVCLEAGATGDDGASAGDILSGKKAYSFSGDLLTGTLIPGTVSPSGKIRDSGATQISIRAESESETQTGYRSTPVAGDRELIIANKVSRSNYTSDCGLTGTVKERIANCASTYPSTATWNGSTQGAYAEGEWKLVARNVTEDLIIWKDTSTGHLWTSVIASGVSFCQAAGVDGVSYTSNCAGNNIPKISYCASVSGFTLAGAGVNQANLSESSGNVTWRLPTRADFLKAELNGLRYAHGLDAETLWTANTWSSAVSYIWVFNGYGDFKRLNWTLDTMSADVMCIGTEFGSN